MKSLLMVLALSFCVVSSSKSPPTLGIYNKFFSRSEWTWYKDSGSWAMLLKHNTVKECFVAINMEPLGYEQENWNFEETLKDFARTKYRVIRIELDGKLWCYTYTTAGGSIALEQVNVYTADSCKACLEAVEKIILNKEMFNKSK